MHVLYQSVSGVIKQQSLLPPQHMMQRACLVQNEVQWTFDVRYVHRTYINYVLAFCDVSVCL
jgi:hypothetical protein